MVITQYIVGDKFTSFSNSSQKIVGIFDFIRDADSYLAGNALYKIGQGLSDNEIYELIKISNKNKKICMQFDFKREKKEFVHKLDEKNVMITKPIMLDRAKFGAHFFVDDDCAEMSDHITGQHIQGMVIIESARQMILSVTENYLLDPCFQHNICVILNKIEINFLGFLFPIEIFMTCEIDILKKTTCKSEFKAIVSFFQDGKKHAQVSIQYSVYEKKWLMDIEEKLASKFFCEQHYKAVA